MRTRRKEISQIRAGDTGGCGFLFHIQNGIVVHAVFPFFSCKLYFIFLLFHRRVCRGCQVEGFGLCPRESVIRTDGEKREMGEKAEEKKGEGYREKNHMAACMQVHGLRFL